MNIIRNQCKRYFMKLSKMFMKYVIYVDPGLISLDVFIAGCVLSYIAIIFNVLVVMLLFRKGLNSPSSVLMQGLAIADGLTAFSSYGLQPIFQPIIERNVDSIIAPMDFPYSAIYMHMSLCEKSFHLLSVILTTSIGLQKVLAIMFPFWTKRNINNFKCVVYCFLCFVFTIALDIPRHLTLKFSRDLVIWNNQADLLHYTSVIYTILHIAITITSSILMLVSTLYIVYKLSTNRFRNPQTEQRRQERRSSIMISIVLAVFFLTEIPKIVLFIIIYPRMYNQIETTHFEFALLVWYKVYVAMSFQIGDKITFPFLLVESMKLFTLIGCMSNFVIYIIMSRKLRIAIWDLFFTSIKNIRSVMCKIKKRAGPIKTQSFTVNDDGSRKKSTTNGEDTINHAEGPIHIEIAVIDIEGPIHNEADIRYVKRPTHDDDTIKILKEPSEDNYIVSDVDGQLNSENTITDAKGATNDRETSRYIKGSTIGRETSRYIKGATIGRETSRYIKGTTNDRETSRYIKGATNDRETSRYIKGSTIKGSTFGRETSRYIKGSTNDRETSRYIKGPTNDETRSHGKVSINDEDASSHGVGSTNEEDATSHGIGSTNDNVAKNHGIGSANDEDTTSHGIGSTNDEDTTSHGIGPTNKEQTEKRGLPSFSPVS